jgi:hypothetical protein
MLTPHFTAAERPLRARQCNLKGANIIFDGYIYQLTNGNTHGGVGKMYTLIEP